VREEIEDKMHFFLEECDATQGIQLFVDLHDGFSGLGTAITEMVREDHGKLPLVCLGLVCPDATAASVLNSAQALVEFTEMASGVGPTAGGGGGGGGATSNGTSANPSVLYDRGCRYSTAAVLAAAWDTASTGFRLVMPILRRRQYV
jgi:hypothetical protein